MAHTKIGTKLYSVVAFASLAMIVVGGVGFYIAKATNDGLDTVYNDRVVCLAQLKTISDMYAINIVKTAQKTLDGEESWGDARKNLAEAREKVASTWKDYTATYLVPEEQKLVNEVGPIMKKADDAISRLDDILARQDKPALAQFNASVLDPVITPLTSKISKLVDIQLRVAKDVYEHSDAFYEKSKYFAIPGLILLVSLSGLFAYIIIKGLLRELGGEPYYVREIALSTAEGNLSVSVDIDPRDQGSVLWAMRHMVENLRQIISETTHISADISSASSRLSATSVQIATAAEEVAAQANTVATASEEMSSTSSDIAHNCTFAADSSRKSSESAHVGATVVKETIDGMARIADGVKQTATTIDALGTRSEQIGNIIGTIEDIADQTNLLALNAAIEAARAGEQGRGFAVVADEVRALAERTTRATKEIGEMIKAVQAETKVAVRAMEEGVREVERGASSSRRSGEALEEILAQINEVTTQINQIATAAEEQTATTGEITSNIHQISSVVQQTASGAEETSSAARELADKAQRLQNLIVRFKIS